MKHLGAVMVILGVLGVLGLLLAGAPAAGASAARRVEHGRTSGTAPVAWRRLRLRVSPAARTGASMAYDPSTGQLVLFGGEGLARRRGHARLLSTTWVWRGATWKKLSPPAKPPARQDATMAYDAATGQLVLFGGAGTTYFLPTTWTWNGTTWKKSPTTPTTTPSARGYASMADDPATGQLVLFGGDNSGSPLGTTWAWSGTRWSELTPTTSPPPRTSASLAYDPATNQLVLFGGTGASARLSTTWLWNGATWTNVSQVTRPRARETASMAYTPGGQLALFGGMGPPGAHGVAGVYATTWVWNGTSWTRLGSKKRPRARAGASMAYDTRTGQLVLFGGHRLARRGGPGLLGTTWVRARRS